MQQSIKTGELAKIRQYPLPEGSEIRKPDAEVNKSDTRRTALSEFAERLSQCTTLAQLLESTVELLMPELGARMVWMGLRREPNGPLELVETRCEDGQNTREPPLRDTFVYRCLTRHQFIRVPRAGESAAECIVAVPILSDRGALGIIYVDSLRRKRILSEADLDFVTIISRRLTPKVEALVAEESKLKEKLALDSLALLREVQTKLNPLTVPQWPELQIAAYSKPGLERSGDIYDVMQLPNGLAALFVGHIDADPSRAALGLVEARSAFRIAGLHADPPHIQLKSLNWLFANNTDPAHLHAAIMVTNPKTGAAELCTAGKIGALVIDPQGQPRRVSDATVPAVGSAKKYEYTAISTRLRPGETLALYTRGCTTACNESGKKLGEQRLIEALCDGFGQPAPAALEGLLSDVGEYLKDGRPPDDITILLAHRIAPETA